MLSALLKSKTLFGVALTYLLSTAALLFVFIFGSVKGNWCEFLFSHWAFEWMEPYETQIATMCIVLAAGTAIFSRLRFREIRSTLGNNNLSMLVFVALVATQSKPLLSRPDVMVASVMLIATFLLLFSTYKQESVLAEVFHIGLGIGVASLFVGQSIILVAVVAVSLLMLRSGSAKEWTVFLLGILMTLVFVWLFVIWNESPFLAFQRIIQSSWLGGFPGSKLSIGNLILLIVSILSMSSLLSNLTTGTVHDRNISLVNMAWIIGAVFMVFLLGLDWQSGFVLAAFPLSNFIAQMIERSTRWWISDTLLILVLSAPFLSSLWLF